LDFIYRDESNIFTLLLAAVLFTALFSFFFSPFSPSCLDFFAVSPFFALPSAPTQTSNGFFSFPPLSYFPEEQARSALWPESPSDRSNPRDGVVVAPFFLSLFLFSFVLALSQLKESGG